MMCGQGRAGAALVAGPNDHGKSADQIFLGEEIFVLGRYALDQMR
jgi:hypothetical protein